MAGTGTEQGLADWEELKPWCIDGLHPAARDVYRQRPNGDLQFDGKRPGAGWHAHADPWPSPERCGRRGTWGPGELLGVERLPAGSVGEPPHLGEDSALALRLQLEPQLFTGLLQVGNDGHQHPAFHRRQPGPSLDLQPRRPPFLLPLPELPGLGPLGEGEDVPDLIGALHGRGMRALGKGEELDDPQAR